MTAIAVGLMVVVTAVVIYTVWPGWLDSRAIAGQLGSCLILGGAGLFSALLGTWWKLNGW